ncbi:hypothetical protein CI610_02738 [invertebrate metagenome]|uniref:Uncharacterized protein n=1 Tax=invertebrate metagenome TaxID=1711999 RepID=A0A2H9T549_9ZZZZ
MAEGHFCQTFFSDMREKDSFIMCVCRIGILFYPRDHKIGKNPRQGPVSPHSHFVTPRLEYPYPTYTHMKESYSI